MNLDCVILAAGLSSRMGKNKMTLEIDGETVIERCVSAFYESCSRIIVVTGKYHEDVKRHLAPYSKVKIAYNGDYGQGMFRSAKEGIAHVESERFFITPGDYPFLKADTIHRMINTAGCFAVPVYEGRQGHPVLLDRLVIPEILISTRASLRDCLRDLPIECRYVRVNDSGVVTDIDTAEDIKRFIRHGKSDLPLI